MGAVSMDGASLTFKDTICVWQRPPPLPDDLNISGWWTLTPVEDGGDVVNFVLHHEPGSNTFSGYQKDFDAIRDGLIDGDCIEWKVDVFRIKGRLEAEGRRLTAMEVTSDLDASFLVVYEGLREEEPANGLCAVCLSDFEHGEQQLRTLSCHWQHCFHTSCIEQWLAIADHCPICRTRVVR